MRESECVLSILLLIAGSLVAVHASIIDRRSFRLPNSHTLVIGSINALLVLAWTTLSGVRILVSFQWLAVVIVCTLLALIPAQLFGMGDAKMIAACAPVMLWWGTFTEWIVLSCFVASVRSVAYMRSGWNQRIAFGPYLTGAWMVVVMGQLACVAMAYCR